MAQITISNVGKIEIIRTVDGLARILIDWDTHGLHGVEIVDVLIETLCKEVEKLKEDSRRVLGIPRSGIKISKGE